MTVHMKVVFTAMALLLPPSSSASCGGGAAGLCSSGKDATSLIQVTRATAARQKGQHHTRATAARQKGQHHTKHRLAPQHGKPDEELYDLDKKLDEMEAQDTKAATGVATKEVDEMIASMNDDLTRQYNADINIEDTWPISSKVSDSQTTTMEEADRIAMQQVAATSGDVDPKAYKCSAEMVIERGKASAGFTGAVLPTVRHAPNNRIHAPNRAIDTAPVKPADALPLGLSCPKSATRGWPAATSLSAEQLRQGAVNLNGAARFRSLLSKLQSKTSGQKLSILVVGGSVENPNFQLACAQKWPSLVAKWLGGSSSSGVEPVLSFFDMQDHSLQLSSPTRFAFDEDWQKLLNSTSNYDLIFVAGSVNSPLMGKPGFAAGHFSLVKDGTVRRRFDEAVLRSLLEHANSPAVMLVNWFSDQALFDLQQATIQEANPGPTFLGTNGLEWHYSTWEDDSYNFLATYYEISMVSGRSALLHSTDLESISGASLGPRFKSTDVFIDGLHPTVLGHTLLSQVVQFGICEQFHLLQESLSAGNAQPTANNASPLPLAVFADADRQLAMRHATDLSGFSSVEAHGNIALSAMAEIPSKPLFAIPENLDASQFNKTGNSSMLPWDLRVTVLPLVILEACVLFGVNQGAPLLVGENSGLHTFALEPFRFLGVLHIVLMHDIVDVKDKFWWQIVASFGKYWVQFFFALSGLVLYMSQRGAPEVSDPVSFVMKRVWGIYPVYGLSILLAMHAMTQHPLGGNLSKLPQATWNYLSQDIMPGLLLVDSWAWPYGTQIPNGPAWFVCTLFAFWLCFPHWYRFLRGVRSPKLVMLFAYLSTFGLPVLYAAKNADHHCHPNLCANWSSFAEFHPFSNWQVFVFGMCMGRVLQDSNSGDVPLALRMTGGTVSLLTLFSLPLFIPTPSDSVLTLFFDKGPLLLPIFAMLLYFLPFGDDILLRPALMESKLLAYSGAMSGHFFLLHIPVKLFLNRIAESGAAPITTMLPLQLLFSIVGYEAHTRLLGPSRSAELKPTSANQA